MCNFPPNLVKAELPLVSTALKATSSSIVLIWRITTAITGLSVLNFFTGEMLASSCVSRKVSVSLH